MQPKNEHTMVDVSCEGADLKDPPEAGLASLLLEVQKALKTSFIPKYCFENRKKKKESCVVVVFPQAPFRVTNVPGQASVGIIQLCNCTLAS